MSETIDIEGLAYFLKDAKNNNLPQPIFFLGAGASRSGGIPLASEIAENIIKNYSENPRIKKLSNTDKNYPNLMNCLFPNQRNRLMKDYVDEAKINVTHIYLAQLMKEGYVDYVLTVNFDNLMLRALALYNIFPPIYDMAILNDLTTTSIYEKSVVYLHGQSHGLWLLNTKEELQKVENTIPKIFNKICNQRPWIFIGYSGGDPIFDHIKELGRFDNGLYWVCYENENPNENVKEFLSSPNTGGFIIKGYDSDSFMLKLNQELGLPQPEIIEKPFTSLLKSLNEIVDINDDEKYKNVKIRLEISKNNVLKAIEQFEKGETEVDKLNKELIKILISENFEEIYNYENKLMNTENEETRDLYTDILNNWGLSLSDSSKIKTGIEKEKLLLESINKFAKAIEIYPDNSIAYNNWGNSLLELAELKTKKKAEDLLLESIDKYIKAIEINPDYYYAYNNWGNVLTVLAKIKTGEEKEKLLLESIDKYDKAIEINPDYSSAYNNWGISLSELAEIKIGGEKEKLFLEAIEKFIKATEINPDYYNAFHNLGISLVNLAEVKKGEEKENLLLESIDKYEKAIKIKHDESSAYFNWGNTLFELAKIKTGNEAEDFMMQSINKYKMAIEINPNYHMTYYNWGSSLFELAKRKSGEEAETFFTEAVKLFQLAIKNGGNNYNLACLYAVKGNIEEALRILELSLNNKEITAQFVEDDEDWKDFRNNEDFVKLLAKYK